MYLIVDYPTKKKTLERLILRCCAVNGAKHVKRTKIRNPRVYIYRATSVMLKSLCVFFFFVCFPKPPWAFVASFFQLNTVWGAGAQFPDSVHWEEKLYDELLLRWLGAQVVRGEGFDKMAPESRLGCGCCVGGVCPSLLPVLTSWVCIVRACCMLGMAPAGLLLTHTRTELHTRESKHSTAADMRGVGLLKHWHFPVTAGLEGMVAADCCWCCSSCCLWFSRAEYRK